MQPPPLPHILLAFRIYRVGLLFIYVLMIGLGAWTYFGQVAASKGGPTMGLTILAIGVVGALVLGVSWLLPERPLTYNLNLLLIVIGIPLVATTPFALLMLWAWLSAPVKEHFNRLEGAG